MFSAWLIFLIIRLAHSITGDDSLKTFLQYLTYFYFLAVPLGIVRFVEKQGIVERFGLQPLRYLGLATLVVADLYLVYLSGLLKWTSFTSVLIAPMTEEMFFRGYMLGEFRNDDTMDILRPILYWLLTAAAFTLSHVFVYQSLGNLFCVFLGGILVGLFYWVTKSILAPIGVHTAWNVFLEAKETSGFSIQLSAAILAVLLVPVVTFIVESRMVKAMDKIKAK
jgi:membrane protease YdiL (CAAX protease family)